MTYVPHYTIVRSIEYIMKCYCNLDSSKAGGQMTWMLCQHLYYTVSYLAAHFGKLFYGQLAQIGRRIYGVK